MVLALVTVLALIAVASVTGLLWRARTGRIRSGGGDRVDLPALGLQGAAATLLQFSTSRCATCRPTAALLRQIAAERPGVAHHEVLLDDRAGIAARFDVLQTPTTLLLDSSGAVRHRIGGAPRPAEVRAAISTLLDDRERGEEPE